jgi:membrane-associated phospholipid phosphatase
MKRLGVPRRAAVSCVLAVALCCTATAQAQLAARTDSFVVPQLYPEYRKAREIALFGTGIGLLVPALLISTDVRDVPASGLDPSEISWGVDRDIVGNSNVDANVLSDWTRTAAVLFPFVLTLATGEEGQRWRGLGRRTMVYAETFLLSRGFTQFVKVTTSRPRPYNYLAAADRPDEVYYDVTQERAFWSFPSGHSAQAWTGATLGMVEHLLTRPDASWLERSSVGLVGGALAGATSALRVKAGQHFPSDVMIGAGVGIATSVTVPLLHRGDQAYPSKKAWLQMTGGAVVGTLLGILAAQGY